MTVTKSDRHSFAPTRVQYKESAGLAFTERNYYSLRVMEMNLIKMNQHKQQGLTKDMI